MIAPVVLGLLAAIGYGVGDFLGGLFGRRVGVVPVLVVGQGAGLVVLGAVTLAFSPPPTGVADLVWGGVAGVAALASTGVLLRGFRVGRISVVSPVSSLGGAGLPIVADVLLGARPSAPATIGMAFGIVAIWLVSTGGPDLPRTAGGARTTGVGYGLVAGAGFAAVYLALDRTDPDSGAWPALAAQVVLVALAILVAAGLRRRPFVPRGSVTGVAAHGIAGALATMSFVFAARAGLVSVAAVIASLSPAITVLLARVVLVEPLPARQVVGLGVAGMGLVLIGMG